MNWKERSKQYDAYLIMIGVAHVKMVEARDSDRKLAYQKVINSLMKEIEKLSNDTPDNS